MAEIEPLHNWPQDAQYWYSLWSFGSFGLFLFIIHFVSPMHFNEKYAAYRNLDKLEKLEWNSRINSSVHAITVCVLCFLSLILDTAQWIAPISFVSRIGCIALAISIGYMFADTLSMLQYMGGMELILFSLHHIVVAVCFSFILLYRVGPFYGILRLLSEISTPFLNLRWFYKKEAGPDWEYKRAISSIIFAITFFIGRHCVCLPFWYLFWIHFKDASNFAIRAELPAFQFVVIGCTVLLDILNLIWSFPLLAVLKRTLHLLISLSEKNCKSCDISDSVNSALPEDNQKVK